jgi:hypothetical protein
VRGAFNGWGTDNQLAYKGKGIYEADILVSPGNHAFKIGSKDWAAEWVANPSASVAVAAGHGLPAGDRAGSRGLPVQRSRPPPTASASTFPIREAGAEREPRRDAGAGPAPIRTRARARRSAELPDLGRQAGNGALLGARTAGAAAQLRAFDHDAAARPRPATPGLQPKTPPCPVRSGNLAFDALFALAATR